jgi:hypothetical protein
MKTFLILFLSFFSFISNAQFYTQFNVGYSLISSVMYGSSSSTYSDINAEIYFRILVRIVHQ